MARTLGRHWKRTARRARARRNAHLRLAVIAGTALALLIIGGLLLASTGKRTAPGAGQAAMGAVSGATQSATPGVAASPRPLDAPPLPHDFSIQTTPWSGGQTFVLSQQWGRPVILYLTASWCFSCLPEVNSLGRLYEKYRDSGLQVLIVDVDPGSSEADLATFKRIGKGADHTWALDRNNDLVRLFDFRTLGTTIVFDKEGNIVYRGVRPSAETLERVLRSLQ